jgi:nucleoside-diphosphate-sugar epimerase
LVTGAGGYVGAALVPQMLEGGYRVKALDLYIYGEHVLDAVKAHPRLEIVRGDIRDQVLLGRVMPGCDAVIHLACISNDPSFELNPQLGKSINLDAFRPLVEIARHCGVRRFINASSSSVYGIKDAPNVTEDMPLEPLTDYSKYKALCEEILAEYQAEDFTTVTVRPATVCGYSPRQRLDVVVNILTNLGYHTGKIKVLGGGQLRPNIHIQDMVDVYLLLLEAPKGQIAGKIFNAGYENRTVRDLAEIVRRVLGEDKVELLNVPTNDNRSYHVSAEKIARELGFRPRHTIEEAVRDLVRAFDAGLLTDPLNNPLYFNIKRMQEIELT